MSAASRERVAAYLASPGFAPLPVIETDGRACVLDVSADSRALGGDLVGIGVAEFSALIANEMQRHDTSFAYGRWAEKRALYDNEHFANDGERRTVHMGVDLFCAAGTAVLAPQDGVVEIVANNARELDYGPLVVLQHATPGGDRYYTLYGHLDLASTQHLRPGQEIAAAERVGAVGRPPENGNWPPHLHFQLILDLLGLGAEFPGVAAASEQEHWLALSPNPARFFRDVSAAELDGRKPAKEEQL